MSSGNSVETFLSTSEGGLTPAKIIATGAVLPLLGIIAVVLRFYVRFVKRVGKVSIDDWMILISLVLTVGLGVMMIIEGALGGLAQPTPQGTGPKGYFTATDSAEIITEKIFWAFDLVQCLAFGTAKLSVLLFYRHIFHGTVFDVMSWVMIGIVICWTVGFFFAILFRCGHNFWALWAPLEYLLANCYNSTPMFQAFTISDVITDVLILTLPVYRTMKLHMTLAKKLAVIGVFLLGAVVVAAGAARLAIFIKQTNDPYQNADGIGHLTTEIFWSMIEMGISVVAACLPTIWPLVASVSVEQMVRTVRSMFSLESLSGSNRSAHEAHGGGKGDHNKGAGDHYSASGLYERVSGFADGNAARTRHGSGHPRNLVSEDIADAYPMNDLEAQQR